MYTGLSLVDDRHIVHLKNCNIWPKILQKIEARYKCTSEMPKHIYMVFRNTSEKSYFF